MDTYLNAVEQYISHCIANGYATKIIFTTGPADDGYETMAGTENGSQRELKHDDTGVMYLPIIKGYCSTMLNIMLETTKELNIIPTGMMVELYRSHANIHPDNMMDYNASWNKISHTEDGDHIGEVGGFGWQKQCGGCLPRIEDGTGR